MHIGTNCPPDAADGAHPTKVEHAFAFCVILLQSGVLYAAFTPILDGQLSAKAGTTISYQVVWGMVNALLLIFVLRRCSLILATFIHNQIVTLFIFLLLISSMSSTSFGDSTIQLTLLFTTFLFGTWFARIFSYKEMLIVLRNVFLLVIVLHGAILALIGTPYHADDRLTLLGVAAQSGLFPHKNYAGITFGLATILFVGYFIAWRPYSVLPLAGAVLSAFFLLLSGSSGATIATFVGIYALFCIWAIKSRRLFFSFILLLGVITVVFWAIASPESLLNLFGRNEELTGRDLMWSLWPMFLFRSPWLGYGYGGFFAANSDSPALELYQYFPNHFLTPNFHNSYLEAGIQAGIPGLILLVLIVVVALWRTLVLGLRSAERQDFLIMFPLVAAISLFAFSESLLVAHNNLMTVIFFAIYFKATGLYYLERTGRSRIRIRSLVSGQKKRPGSFPEFFAH